MSRILNSFLQFIEQDSSDSIIIAATNNQKLLDQALFRRFDDVLHYSMPTAESIAEALAAKERVRIVPYGDHAAFKLGLTGLQVSHLKYLTDGASRVINLSSEKKIFFNHTSEVKIFDFCNDTMQMVASAIRVLTEECLDAEKKRIIHKHLRTVPEEEFMKDITIPPA